MSFDVRDTRNKNWCWMRRELLRKDGDELGAYGVAVYAALASYADEDSTAYPSLGAVAEMLGCSRRQVRREINTLAQLGWIRYEERKSEDGANTSHMFYLLSCPYDSQSGPSDSQSEGVRTHSPTPSDTQSDKVETNEVEPNEESESARPREDKAVQVYHDVMPRRANNVQKDYISTRVEDLGRWREVLRDWRAEGYSPKSVKKMLDVYENGWRNENSDSEPNEIKTQWHG